jgi:CheY-like chemotaxis protein
VTAPDPARDELSELKGQFLATLNHEIRTPLSGILGMLDLLAETELSGEQREYAESGRSCAQNLLEIMNATLDYSALCAGQVRLEEAEFPIRELLERLGDCFVFKAKSKGLRFFLNIDENLPELAIGDAVLIRQMLANLIDNAIKFTNQGDVEVIAGTIVLPDRDALLTVRVRDTGIGIAAEMLPSIFDPFRQLETGLSRRYSGMGLGLAVTQKLARLMRAELHVESHPGRGSTFGVSIPLKIALDTRNRAKSEGRPSILLVADSSMAHSVTMHVLARRSYVVECANTSAAAIEKASERLYDLVLLDLQLPGMDAAEMSSRMRSIPGYADVPMLALTAGPCLDYSSLCAQNGMQGFVPKPVESRLLLRTVERFLPVQKAPGVQYSRMPEIAASAC